VKPNRSAKREVAMTPDPLRRAGVVLVLSVLIGTLLFAVSGCAATPTGSQSAPLSQSASSSMPATAPAENPTPTPSPELSVRVLAKGGSGHQGQALYLSLVATADTKAAAEQKCESARSALGEFETYYVVDESSHFEGLAPGAWIVFEPYKYKQNADSQTESAASWLESAGLVARVTKVRVLCGDSFPLVEDKLEGLYSGK
jgi:hypothetical protein